MQVYIFGASLAGKKCYDDIKDYCDVLGFIDNDVNKWGKRDHGIPIFSSEILKNVEEYDLIIIASMYAKEIMLQLEELDIDNFILPPISSEDIKHIKFDKYIDYCKEAYKFYKKLNDVISKLDNTSISDYNKRYLRQKNVSDIYLCADIMWNIFKYHGKPKSIIDYGGGSGVFGIFAKYLGIEDVYYNDIYEVSCNDAKTLASEMNIELNDYILGNIGEVVEYSTTNNVYFDVVSSYDVLEHIYNLKDFFEKLPQICRENSFVGMWTGANSYNDKIVNELKITHFKCEYLGSQKVEGWKERDSFLPFVKIREQIIREYFNEREENIQELDLIELVKNTKGKDKEDIYSYLNEYLVERVVPAIEYDKFPSNTADPLTGNWAEHLIDFDEWLKNINSFNKKYIVPEDKEKSMVIGLCLQNRKRL